MIDLVAGLAPVPLREVLATASLQDRVDRKYLVDRDTAARLVQRLSGDVRALEVDGARVAAYSTVYFDSADLACHRAHLQGRRRRWKARTRRYLDGDLCRLELKTKGPRGRTIKDVVDVAAGQHGRLDASALAFLDERLAAAYGTGLDRDLAPALTVTYSRATLVGAGERLTLDAGLDAWTPDGRHVTALSPRAVLVESKAGSSPGLADRVLRDLGVRETDVSKYCAGLAVALPALPAPALRPVLRRWFVDAEPLSAAA